jgi:tetratricopeptide (TPR) repeat protein
MSPSAGLHRFLTLFRGSPSWSAYLFGAVLLVRLITLTRLTSSPLLFAGGSDMQFYDDWAKQILHGHWTDHRAFYGLPLYPFLVAFLYRIFSYSPFVPGFFQACLDAGTAVLIYKLTVRAITGAGREADKGSNITGIVAAAGWCFFVPAQAYSAILMPTAGAVFVFWLLVWQIVRADKIPSRVRLFACGLLIGFTAMGVATILFVIPLFIAAIFIRETQPRLPAKGIAVLLLMSGVFTGTAPCWIHNYFVARDRVFLSAHGGINFWLGNNPDATGYPRFPGLHAGQGQMLRESIDQAEAAAGHPLKRSEVSRYWSNQAREYIAAQPGAWLKLLARKVANFWNAFEYDDLGVIVNLRDHGVLFPGLHFGFVAALGLAGAFLAWRAFPVSGWITAAIAVQLVALLPVFVTERYRLPVVPGLLVLATLGLHRIWETFRNSSYGKGGVEIGVVILSSLVVAIPRHDPSLWALEAYNSGRFALETNDLTAADNHLRRAYALVPDNAEITFALGNLRVAQGDLRHAVDYYEAALKLDPQHKGALNNLGVLALNANQSARAIGFLRRAILREPNNPKTHYLLARALDLAGDRAQARAEAARAVELDPRQAEYAALEERLNEK